jgi:uridine kinase
LGQACLWITHDRYYKTMPEALRDDPTAHNFDHPAALDTPALVADIASLRAGQPAKLPGYDFARHRRLGPDAWDLVEPRPLIIVEGILVLSDPDLRAQMDHRVFVHAPDDIRLIRRIRRDVSERGRHVSEILHQYEKTVRPMHVRYVAPSRAFADLVVDGTTTTEAMVASVLGLVGDLVP